MGKDLKMICSPVKFSTSSERLLREATLTTLKFCAALELPVTVTEKSLTRPKAPPGDGEWYCLVRT